MDFGICVLICVLLCGLAISLRFGFVALLVLFLLCVYLIALRA